MHSTSGLNLRRPAFLDSLRPASFAFRFRARRAVALRRIILNIVPVAADGRCRILDIGGLPRYWRIVGLDWLRSIGAEVTLLNLHPIVVPPDCHDVMQSVTGDGCALDGVPDGSVDLAHSNSVIEHVGSPERMVRFAQEIRRVGRAYYVQTPNFWFPIEPHYMAPAVHWLPTRWREALVWHGMIGIPRKPSDRADAARIVREQQLLTPRQMRELFPEAELRAERFCGLAKSLIAVHPPGKAGTVFHFTGEGN